MGCLKTFFIFLLGMVCAFVLLIEAGLGMVRWGSTTRLAAPPQGAKVSYPWGVFDLDELQSFLVSDLHREIDKSFLRESKSAFDPNGDGVRTCNMRLLSGGGSNGPFGAGLLRGWTLAGTPPDFKVVAGISTGSLQAVAAFLGPDYDGELREIFTVHQTSDIYEKRPLLAPLFDDAICDTWPLKEIIDKHMTGEVLEAVAGKYNRGHELFIGTTNLNTAAFGIWDMGRIASSGWPDALEQFRKVLLASCTVPVLFPPVYFEVEADGETYYEMHVDGSTYAQVFSRGFMLDFEDALESAGILVSKVRSNLYIIRNGKIEDVVVRRNVKSRTVSVAATTISTLFKITS